MTSPAQSIHRGHAASLARPIAIGSDDRLARLAGGGHERAFAVLYERYHQRLYRYLRSMLRHDADAQDALQATFAKAFTALAEDRRDAPLRPWLYRIAHNEAITVMRRRRPEVGLAAAGDLPAPSADEQAAGRARLALLVTDLAELTERQRGALVMRELSGLSHGEIESALELEPGGAKATIFEARRSLAEFAQGRAMSCDDVCRAISDGTGRTLRGRKIRAHLRDCGGCAAFAAAIPGRSRDLRALAPPLPAAAAAGLLVKLGSMSGTGGAGGAGTAGAAGGATGTSAGAAATTASGVGKLAALSISSKLLAGAAVAVIAAGAGAVIVPALRSAGHAAGGSGGAGHAAGTRHNSSGHGASAHGVGTSAGATTAHGHGRSAAQQHGARARTAGRAKTGHGQASRATTAGNGRGRAATTPGSSHAQHAGSSTPVGAHGSKATGHVISKTAGHNVARRLGLATGSGRTHRSGTRSTHPPTTGSRATTRSPSGANAKTAPTSSLSTTTTLTSTVSGRGTGTAAH